MADENKKANYAGIELWKLSVPELEKLLYSGSHLPDDGADEDFYDAVEKSPSAKRAGKSVWTFTGSKQSLGRLSDGVCAFSGSQCLLYTSSRRNRTGGRTSQG